MWVSCSPFNTIRYIMARAPYDCTVILLVIQARSLVVRLLSPNLALSMASCYRASSCCVQAHLYDCSVHGVLELTFNRICTLQQYNTRASAPVFVSASASSAKKMPLLERLWAAVGCAAGGPRRQLRCNSGVETVGSNSGESASRA